MVEFLKTISGEGFTFEAGKRYPSTTSEQLEDSILVRQPNSPKDHDWYAKFPLSKNGELFRILDDKDLTPTDKQTQNRLDSGPEVLDEDTYNDIMDAAKTLCDYCQNDACESCQVTRLTDDAYVEALHAGIINQDDDDM